VDGEGPGIGSDERKGVDFYPNSIFRSEAVCLSNLKSSGQFDTGPYGDRVVAVESELSLKNARDIYDATGKFIISRFN
jgi:hypothetical protein